jgi:hypothetical protein
MDANHTSSCANTAVKVTAKDNFAAACTLLGGFDDRLANSSGLCAALQHPPATTNHEDYAPAFVTLGTGMTHS